MCYTVVMENLTQEFKNFIFSYLEYREMDHNKLKLHMHPFYEILYLIDGAVDYVIEDNRYHLEKGDILLINPAYHHFVQRITKAPYARFVINFIDDFLPDPTLVQEIFSKGDKVGAFFHLPPEMATEKLLFLLKDMLGQVKEDRLEMLCRNFLNGILLSLTNLEGTQPKKSDTISQKCRELVDYININLTSLQNLDDLANHFFFSKTYINHIFKKEMGVSVMQFICNKKILLAEKLIRNGRKPSEVYLDCGFSNYVTFYRAYYRYLGINPAETKKDSSPQ